LVNKHLPQQHLQRAEKEILDNHRSVWCSVKISTKDDELDLPLLLDDVQILNFIHNIFDSREAEVAISIIEQLQSWFYDLWSQKVKLFF
jgi:hypothetical protein